MQIPLSWISLYTDLSNLIAKKSIKDIAHEYSIHTAEIDGIEEHFIDKVVVGKVLSCEKHPESKKLSIVKVYLWEYGEETILTGAANIADATYVPVAMVGAVLPGDFVIADRMMAGMMSRGMICGADEIGMSTEASTGIMILEEDWEREVLEDMIGKSFFDLTLAHVWLDGKIYHFPLRDTTFEIDNKFITNRPDLFSVLGNAREFHAVFDLPFVPYIPKSLPQNGEKLSVEIQTDKVLAYHLLSLDDISVEKSPFGIRLMLELSGLSPKNNLVDITNSIMTELGQPMHVFDRDMISGNISVRMGKSGEKFIALDDKEYTLTDMDIVIADDEKILALAGIIWGKSSSVTHETKNTIWESASFDPITVRLSSQRHGLRTDASMRYEKSLDPLLANTTFSRVFDYLSFLWKTYKTKAEFHFTDVSKINHITIEIQESFIDSKAGIIIPTEIKEKILWDLGFSYTKKDTTYTITVPSWRATKDIFIQEDIAEEITRVYGYENTPLTPLSANFSISSQNSEILLRNQTLSYFVDQWANEVYNYSFTSETLNKKALLDDMCDAIGIQNAFNEEYTHMSSSLAPRLFLDIWENLRHSEKLFFIEIGKISSKNPYKISKSRFLQNIEKKPFFEEKVIAGVILWKNLEEIRKILEKYLIQVIGFVPPIESGTALPFLHPGISGRYHEWELSILEFGKIHPAVAENFWLPTDIFYFEANFNTLLDAFTKKEVFFHPISKYQTIRRELNFLLPENTPTGEIARDIDASHPWIGQVVVDSIYQDEEKIGSDKKSVSFSFILSNTEWTINDEEALSVQNLIIHNMKEKGYNLRWF